MAVPRSDRGQILGGGYGIPSDRLVAAVLASDVTEPAVDALLLVDPRDDLVVEVEFAPRLDPGHRAADELINRPEALVAHPAFEAARQVLDDPEALEEPFHVTVRYGRDRYGQLLEFQCSQNDRNEVDENGDTKPF